MVENSTSFTAFFNIRLLLHRVNFEIYCRGPRRPEERRERGASELR
jgi:hypothetical protein